MGVELGLPPGASARRFMIVADSGEQLDSGELGR